MAHLLEQVNKPAPRQEARSPPMPAAMAADRGRHRHAANAAPGSRVGKDGKAYLLPRTSKTDLT
jgi:hypothetical protein